MVDTIFTFLSKGGIDGTRKVPDKLSNGDDNIIQIEVTNRYLFKTQIKLIDEVPFQFQKRDFGLKSSLKSGEQNHTLTNSDQRKGAYTPLEA